MVCSSQMQMSLIQRLLVLGANVDSKATNGSTPLHWAAGAGLLVVVDFLLDTGARVDSISYTWTYGALFVPSACQCRRTNIYCFSLPGSNRRQVFGKGSGQTPLHWAAEGGHAEVVDLLISRSSLSVVASDERGQTPRVSQLHRLMVAFDRH